MSSSAQTLSDQDADAQLKQVVALRTLTDAPAMMDAEGVEPEGSRRAIYFDGLPWKGKPTKVFAWLGLPEKRQGKVPGVVLVHGGGGTAFKEWVDKWNDRGYAAISIAVEGQTDRKDAEAKSGTIPTGWKKHEWSGPWRTGIYADTAEPLKDQWMYHAVADTILANSLLRSLPEVNADQVGLMGISWGGVITSTAIGIDDRFAFAIPVYGCGHLFDAANQYGRSLGNNDMYKKVWDPVLRLGKAKMPILWFSWPQDKHFPLDCQAACYRAAAGPQMVSLVPGMGHGHGPGWNRPESYAFADAVLQTGKPWCWETGASFREGRYRVTFESEKPFDRAVLVSTVDGGITGDREWVESPASLTREGSTWVATAEISPDTTGWFVNLHSGDLVATSGYKEQAVKAPGPRVAAGTRNASSSRDHLLRLFKNMDVNTDDLVSQAEFTELWKKNFRHLDKNGDRALGANETPPHAPRVADTDGDGRITAEEDEAMRLRHFTHLDKDTSGALTLKELLQE